MTVKERDLKRIQKNNIGTVDAFTATKITKDTAFLTVQGFAYTGSQSEMKHTLGLWLIGWYMGLAFEFSYATNWTEIDLLGSTAIMWMFSPFVIWHIVKWRQEIPICFSRKKQKVFYWIDNELVQVSWKNFNFYFATHPGLSTSGLSYGDAFTLVGKKSHKHHKVFANYQGGYQGLNRFMSGDGFLLSKEEKIDILRGNFRFGCKDVFRAVLRPFTKTLFSRPFKFMYFFHVPLLLIVIFGLILPTRLMVLVLNKILPRKKLPAELLEACGLDKDYKVYG